MAFNTHAVGLRHPRLPFTSTEMALIIRGFRVPIIQMHLDRVRFIYIPKKDKSTGGNGNGHYGKLILCGHR